MANLKGRADQLRYFRYKPTGNRIPRTLTRQNKSIRYFEEELERVYFEEKEVAEFSLDRMGLSLPTYEGNVIFVHHYLLDFWNYFIKPEGLNLYLHLRKFCYGKDYCWPELQTLCDRMDKSRETIRKYLELLESYGLIYQFQCENISRNNMQESPIYKVRKEFPFLTEELIEQLPDRLKRDHDRFMAELANKVSTSVNILEKVNYEEIFNEFMANGEVKPVKRSSYQQQKISRIKLDTLRAEQTEKDITDWNDVIALLSKSYSKNTMDTWFKETFMIKKGPHVWVYTPNNFVKQWLQERFKQKIKEALMYVLAEYIELHLDTYQ